MTHSDTRAETWKAIPGASSYQASDAGRVRSVDRVLANGRRQPGKVLSTRVSNKGYVLVDIVTDDGRAVTRSVHRLVLLAHAGPCPDGMEACHGNDISTDNRWPENLRWDDPPSNLADRFANGPPRAPKPLRHCILCGDIIDKGGKRCHACVVTIGKRAAEMLCAGIRLADACEALNYPSAEGLHELAVKYGLLRYAGHGERTPSRSQRVTSRMVAMRDRFLGGDSA